MTLALDFDGVIHGYRLGWHDGTIYDSPLPGAIEGLHALMEQDAVFIHTSREPEQVMPWLEGLGFDVTIDERCGTCFGAGGGQEVDLDDRPTHPAWDCDVCKGSGLLTFWSERGQLLVTNRKLPALAYLDDRAVRFNDWPTALTALGINRRLLSCGLCYEEWGEEVHPHPLCPIGSLSAPLDGRTHIHREQLREQDGLDTAIPCCVCGGGPIEYDNYLGQLFCWRCADCDCGRDGPCLRTGLHRPAAGVCTATWQHPHRGLIRCEDEAEHYTSDYCIHRGRTPDGAPMQWRDGDKGSTPHNPDPVRTPPETGVRTGGIFRMPSGIGEDGCTLTIPDAIRTPPDADASGYPEARRAQIRAAIDTAFGDGRCSCGQTTPLLGSTAGGYHFHLTREDHDRLVRQREGVDGWHPAVDAWGQCWVRAQEAKERADRAEKAYDGLRTDVYTAARYIQVQSTSRLGRHSRRRILSVLPAWIREHGPLTPKDPIA